MSLEERYPQILFPGIGRGGQKCLPTGGAAIVGFGLTINPVKSGLPKIRNC
jgi:hypothetical protein